MIKVSNISLTIKYSILEGCYWAAFCALYGFATVFLLDRGFSSSQIGIIVASGNILAVLVQPFLAGLADKYRKHGLHNVTMGLFGMGLLAVAGLYAIKSVLVMVAACFMITAVVLQVTMPLTNSINFYYENRGYKPNFGIARAIGSVSYGGVSSLLGVLIVRYNVDIVLPVGAGLWIVVLIIMLLLPRLEPKYVSESITDGEGRGAGCLEAEAGAEGNAGGEETATGEDEKSRTTWGFIRHYKYFSIVLLGVVGLFFFHNMTNTYMIQVINSMGGDSEDMGYLFTIAAVLELPTLLALPLYINRFKSSTLMKIAGVAFAAKAISYLLCTSVTQMYLAQILQFASYALYTAASVYFVNEVMEDRDKVRGQAFMTMTNTVASVMGSLIGGFVVDYFGVREMLYLSAILCTLGAVLIVIFAGRAMEVQNGGNKL